MRTAERSGYLASSCLICSRYGSSRLARGAAVCAGGCCNFRAAATVCREQRSRRAIAQPESLSISARRRISAHKATFMTCPSVARQRLHCCFGWRVQLLPGAICRPASSAPGLAPRGDARPAPAPTAPAPAATHARSDHAPATLAELFPGPARTTATGWTARCRCRTTGRACRPRRRGTGTAGWPRATDGRRARVGNGDPPRTSPSPVDVAVVAGPECVFRSCLGLRWATKERQRTLRPRLRRFLGKAIDCRPAQPGRLADAAHGGGRGGVMLAASYCLVQRRARAV